MEQEKLHSILRQIEALTSPASFTVLEHAIAEHRNRLREELREELRRSLNYSHIKLHPDLKKHGFEFTERIKDLVASLIADVLVNDGCTWDQNPIIKIEPAMFLSPSQSLQDSAVVVVHLTDGKGEHRSASFRYL